MKILALLQTLLFPEKCVLCARVLDSQETDLCRKCRVEAPYFAGVKNKYPYLDSLTAVWYYEDKVRRSILRYKFGGRRNYAQSYGRMLAMAVQQAQLQIDFVTWIPISTKRLRKRGFDQVELLARSLCRELGMEPVATLQKVHDNPPQSHITGSAERRANVLGVYQALEPKDLAGKRILLLDDIITTGATAGECARVLLTAGAKEVHCAVIAAARQHKKKQ